MAFDRFDETGRFFGLRRLNLEANPDYAAPVRDRLGMWFMREAGLPASRVALFSVKVNGNDYGPYLCIEPVDKEFLSDHFEDPEGDLYDDDLDPVTNSKTGDPSRLAAFFDLPAAAVSGGDPASAVASLAPYANFDGVVALMAAEAALGTVDNFSDGAGNTYFYDQHPGPGITPIPWDLDDIFSPYGSATEPLDSCQGPSKFSDAPLPLCQVMQADPGLRTALRKEIRRLRDEVYPGLGERAQSYCSEARPLFLSDPFSPYTLAQFDADCAAILSAIADRAAYLAAHPELQ